MEELARRAVACKGWRWMPGMACVHPKTGERFRLTDNNWCDQDGIYADPETEEAPCIACDSGPDLTDPATLGCLLALVRKAWCDPSLCANDAGTYDLMFWHVYTDDKFVSVGCQTEAEALVAALEAAP